MKKRKIYVTTVIEFEYDERKAGDDQTASSIAYDLASNPNYGTVECGVHLLNVRLCGREETGDALKKLLGLRGDGGAARIAAERQRQIRGEGYSPESDRRWKNGELARAAAAYATPEARVLWPFGPQFLKRGDRERELEKAGALIAAELDRLTAERGDGR